MRLSGTVKTLPAPELSVVPPLINIGSIKTGNTINRDIELVNSGELDLRITEILTTPSCKAQVHLPDGKELEIPEGEKKSTELLITPKNKLAMKIVCKSNLTKGRFQESIIIKSNSRRIPVYNLAIRGFIE